MTKALTKEIPKLPGVYLFKDATGQVVYIGKAKVLSNRVKSYFRQSNVDWKVVALMEEYADLDFIVTKSENEALLLEAQLIQQYKPRFNVLFKTGQPFLYILFTSETVPTIKIVRNKKEKGAYFGPFLQKTQARRVHHFLVKTFKLKRCNKKLENGCLDYHLGNCPGNCMTTFDNADYTLRLQLAMDVLRNKDQAFLTKLREQITKYNKEMAFEKSKRLAVYLDNFQTIFETIKAHFSEKKFHDQIYAATVQSPAIDQDPAELARNLQLFLQTEGPIRSIDCFDISHFQSRSIVGSCVRFVDGKPDKNKFRRFLVRTLEQQNDYAALQEVVRRRYRNGDIPDLVLIDGGKGQLGAIKQIMPYLNCVSLAKKEELLYGTSQKDPIVLNVHNQSAKTLIKLRDYAHHFAISYHRLRRKKEQLSY